MYGRKKAEEANAKRKPIAKATFKNKNIKTSYENIATISSFGSFKSRWKRQKVRRRKASDDGLSLAIPTIATKNREYVFSSGKI